MHREKREGVYRVAVPTAMGRFGVSATARGVAMVFLPGAAESEVSARLGRYAMKPGPGGQEQAIAAALELLGYLSGQLRRVDTPIDLSHVTPFQKAIYRALASTRFGEKITYGELARRAGHPGKARAAGAAMRCNPAPIFIPCHRVVPASGGPGGWSGPSGWKDVLQRHEGIRT